jgi:hypothetical protein
VDCGKGKARRDGLHERATRSKTGHTENQLLRKRKRRPVKIVSKSYNLAREKQTQGKVLDSRSAERGEGLLRG